MDKGLNPSEVYLINELQEFNILSGSTLCFKCNKHKFLLGMRKRNTSKQLPEEHMYYATWRCKCGQYKIVRDQSFFSLYKTPLYQLTLLIKFWSVQLTITKSVSLFELITEEKIHRETVGSLFLRLRNICTVLINKHKFKLGGKGKVVEIDESLVAKVKHHRGKDLKRQQVWIFGLISRETKQCYIEIVPDRTGFTLCSIIYDHVLQESIIYSDTLMSLISSIR